MENEIGNKTKQRTWGLEVISRTEMCVRTIERGSLQSNLWFLCPATLLNASRFIKHRIHRSPAWYDSRLVNDFFHGTSVELGADIHILSKLRKTIGTMIGLSSSSLVLEKAERKEHAGRLFQTVKNVKWPQAKEDYFDVAAVADSAGRERMLRVQHA